MCSRWSFPFVLLSLIGSVTASSLRERNTLSIAPRTAYHFSNNYADSSCLQLVSGHMEVRYANTTSFYSRPCAAQQTIYGTVYYKEVLAEFDKFESCTAGLVGRWRAHRKTLQLYLFSSNILSGNNLLNHYIPVYITSQIRLAQLLWEPLISNQTSALATVNSWPMMKVQQINCILFLLIIYSMKISFAIIFSAMTFWMICICSL